MISNPHSNKTEDQLDSSDKWKFSGHEHETEAGEVDLKEFFYTLWAAKWTILGSILAGGVLALLIALLQTPLYEANGTLMIRQTEQSGSLASMLGGNSALSGLIGSSFGIGSGVNISNEMEVLKSRKMFRAMAKKLLDDPIMDNGRMYPVLWKDWPDDSTTVPLRNVAARIDKNITYELQQGTTIIEITYESPSALEAAYIVDLVMRTYQNISKEQNIELAGSATEFLVSEKTDIKDSLSHAMNNLEQFMEEQDVVALEAQTTHLIEQIAELRKNRFEAEAKLRGIVASIKEYERRVNDLKPGLAEKLASATGSNIRNMQFEVSELKTRKALIYARRPDLKTAEDQPYKIINLNSQIAQLQKQIKAETDSLLASSEEFIGLLGQEASTSVVSALIEYSRKLIELRVTRLQLEAQVDYLTELLDEQVQFLQNIPANYVELARLKRNVKVLEQLYMAVTQKRTQVAMAAKAELGNGRPLDTSLIPEKPSSPVYLLYLLIGLFTAGVLSVGYVIMASALSNTIYSSNVFEELNLTLLSVIPKFASSGSEPKGAAGRPLSQMPSGVAKALHRLANTISYTDGANPNEVLMLTAPVGGEGTTTVSGSLAVELAKLGNKVVVIETAQGNSGLNAFFGVKSDGGLKQVVHKIAAFEDAVNETGVPDLHLLSSGTQSPMPVGMLHSKDFEDLVLTLRKEYDYILFDAPAVSDSNNATDLAGVVDNAVVVTEFGKTRIPELEFTFEQLANAKIKVLGSVLNKYKAAKAHEYRKHAYQVETN